MGGAGGRNSNCWKTKQHGLAHKCLWVQPTDFVSAIFAMPITVSTSPKCPRYICQKSSEKAKDSHFLSCKTKQTSKSSLRDLRDVSALILTVLYETDSFTLTGDFNLPSNRAISVSSQFQIHTLCKKTNQSTVCLRYSGQSMHFHTCASAHVVRNIFTFNMHRQIDRYFIHS